MDLQTKRLLKRKLRMSTWTAFICITTFILGFIFIMVFHKYLSFPVRVILGGITLCSPVLGLFFSGYGQQQQWKINRYRHSIREYRICKLFYKCIQLINEDRLSEAIDFYNQMPKSNKKDFLYAYIICAFKQSTDPKIKTRGMQMLSDVMDDHNPDDINNR